jgi:hypothetical protein
MLFVNVHETLRLQRLQFVMNRFERRSASVVAWRRALETGSRRIHPATMICGFVVATQLFHRRPRNAVLAAEVLDQSAIPLIDMTRRAMSLSAGAAARVGTGGGFATVAHVRIRQCLLVRGFGLASAPGILTVLAAGVLVSMVPGIRVRTVMLLRADRGDTRETGQSTQCSDDNGGSHKMTPQPMSEEMVWKTMIAAGSAADFRAGEERAHSLLPRRCCAENQDAQATHRPDTVQVLDA